MTQPSTTALRPGEGGFGSLVLISIECKMKSLKLNELGVSALDAKELAMTEGGNVWKIVFDAYMLKIAIFDGIHDVYEGFKETYKPKN